MGDGRAASPLRLTRKGQAVLGSASAMDHERCARPIPRLRTCHSDVFQRHREGDWQLRSIFSARLLHPATTQHSSNACYGTRPFTHTKSVVQGRALVREGHFRLSLTLSSRLFLLQVANFPVNPSAPASTGWQCGPLPGISSCD